MFEQWLVLESVRNISSLVDVKAEQHGEPKLYLVRMHGRVPSAKNVSCRTNKVNSDVKDLQKY